MKSATRLLTLSTLVLAAVLITMLVSPADASKRAAIESGDIAFVDVFKLIDHALVSEEAANARTEFTTQSNEVLDGLKGQLAELETQLSTMQQGDPQAATVYQKYQSISAQHDNAAQQISAAYQMLVAQQLALAYADIYAAANEIGSQEGFVFVFATRSTGELVQTNTIAGVTQEILARPLMTPPAGVDITELVRIKLGYPEELPVPAVEPQTQEPVTEPAIEPVEEPAQEPAEESAETPASEDG